MSYRWIGRFMAMAAAAAFLVNAGAAQAQARDKVVVGKSVTFSITFTTIDYGHELKIWDQVGLNVEAVAFGGDARMQQAMTSGDIDIGLGSGPGMGYRVKGVPGIGVAAIAGQPNNMALMVRPDSAIKDVDGLKGRIVGVTTAGSLTDWLVRELSRQRGWGPEGIKIIPMGAERTRYAAMKTGEIDGNLMTTAVAYDWELKNDARILVLFGDIVKDFHTHVLFATDKMIASRPQVLERFLRGWFMTVKQMKADPVRGKAFMANTLKVDPKAMDRAYDAETAMMSDDGVFNPRALEVIRNSFKELGILDTVPEAKAIYSDRFVPVKF
jgi:ABC-type nitrate/sulfonate/bicarbonate transport system substrate-binding protein